MLCTPSFGQEASGVYIGLTATFKHYDLIRIHDRYFTLERDTLDVESFEVLSEQNERILIIH